MGFFKSILGGSKSSSSSASGFYALPKIAQDAFTDMTKQATAGLLGQNGINAFTPSSLTSQGNQAINQITQGIAPTTAADVGGMASMYMNPFNQFLTDNINKEAQGQYSLYGQALANSGQMGSNREYLNAAAADNARLNAIGTTQANQWNNALTQGFAGKALQQQDVENLLAADVLQRGITDGGKLAEVNALTALAQLLGTYPSTSTESSKGSSSNGAGGLISAVGGLFSDRRLKENIIHLGMENDYNIYEFSYIGNPRRFIGVMAQEVEERHPEAVVTGDDGFKRVNYPMIGVQMREVA